jgi:hypothetical protein
VKVYTISESELDERLNLDKRRNNRAFCLCFDSLDEAPADFYKLQDKIRDGLEKEFWASFQEGKEPPRYKWETSPTNKWFFFDGDMHGSERMVIELADNIIGDKLLGIIMAYLEKSAPSYCVVGEVFRGELTGKNYKGRIVINCEEIAVEESLVQLWTKQVHYMEIERQ